MLEDQEPHLREDDDLLDADGIDAGDVEVRQYAPEAKDRGARLDRYLADQLPDLSRSYLQGLIADGRVLVDGQTRRASFKLTPGEVVTLEIPPTEEFPLEPEPIPLTIVFEDADVIVLDKPAGLVVHPAPGHPSGTLVNALLYHAPEIAIGGSNRPGIVHRLDKDTSGLMVVAKTDRAQQSLLAQWAARTVQKEYLALVAGTLEEDEATIDAPIGREPVQRQRMAVFARGKPAITHFTTLERFEATSLADVRIETGRTHQIRVHFAFIGHPIVGDAVYGRDRATARRRGEPWLGRHFLHAHRLGFQLPTGRDVRFESPLPRELARVLDGERAALSKPAERE